MEAKNEGRIALRAWAALTELLQAKGLITEDEKLGVIAEAHDRRGLGPDGVARVGGGLPELFCTD